MESYKEPFEAALKDGFKYADQGIWYRTQDATESPVWSNADDDEIGVLVKVLLSKGETSPAAASLVRNVVSAHDYISVALIVGPRLITTADRLAKAPKREKKKRGQPG